MDRERERERERERGREKEADTERERETWWQRNKRKQHEFHVVYRNILMPYDNKILIDIGKLLNAMMDNKLESGSRIL